MGLYHTTSTNTVRPCVCTVSTTGTDVTMEIDTGALVSMISEKWTRIKRLVPQLTLNTNKAPLLRTYTGRTIQPLGQVRLGLDRNNQHRKLNAPVVPGSEPNLLERD